MRFLKTVNIRTLSAIFICLSISCIMAQNVARGSEDYKVIYKFPNTTGAAKYSDPKFLDAPVYAMGGKAVVFDLPTGHISVIADGKKQDFVLPAKNKPLGNPSAVVVEDKLYYNLFDNENFIWYLGIMDLNTGKCDHIAIDDAVDIVPVNKFVSPNGKLTAEDTDDFKVLDLQSGKGVPLPKLIGYYQLLGWNKTSDGLYLLRSNMKTGSYTTESSDMFLWKLGEEKPIKVAALQGDVDPDFVSLSLSANKLAWINRKCLFVTDLTSGKTAKIAHVNGYGTHLRMSPGGRYLLMNYALPDNSGNGFRIYELSTGNAYTRVCTLKFPELMPFIWHPTQDKLLAIYAYSMTKLELREYTADELIRWIVAKNSVPKKHGANIKNKIQEEEIVILH